MKTLKGTVIKRHKCGVGKHIMQQIYFHRQYLNEIDIVNRELIKCLIKELDEKGFEFNIIRYSLSKQTNIAFINSPDFDTSDEPFIKDSYLYIGNLIHVGERAFKQIYHHKWLFVKDDYSGFDVAKSKARSEKWLALPGIDYNRIGYQDYWNKNVIPKIK